MALDDQVGASQNTGDRLLQVEDVSLAFSGVQALNRVSLDVIEGSITGLIGSNGAGKSTMFNCISGIYPVDSGIIRFGGHDILRMPVRARSGVGISRSFQNVALFEHLDVLENVLLGAHARARSGYFSAGLRLPWSRREERELRDEALDLLHARGLGSVASARVDELPYGTRKRIELVRALMAHPRLLMLDEPAAGLPHGEVSELAEEICDLNASLGVTVMLVEHHMGMVMSTCERVVVLDHGQVLATGTPQEVQENSAVVDAYLGG